MTEPPSSPPMSLGPGQSAVRVNYSCRRSSPSELLPQRLQPAAHAGVEELVAHARHGPAEDLRIDGEARLHRAAQIAREPALDVLLIRRRQRYRGGDVGEGDALLRAGQIGERLGQLRQLVDPFALQQ